MQSENTGMLRCKITQLPLNNSRMRRRMRYGRCKGRRGHSFGRVWAPDRSKLSPRRFAA